MSELSDDVLLLGDASSSAGLPVPFMPTDVTSRRRRWWSGAGAPDAVADRLLRLRRL